MLKLVRESFDNMDGAYEVASYLSNKYGRKIKDLSSSEIKEEINNWLKKSGWLGELDSDWIYDFLINDVFDEMGLNESKKVFLNEGLSSDKEAFLILDKLSSDLKKIYDQENYKIYEDERINKAINDLITLEIKFPIIKELIHYVAQSTYERKYDAQELLKMIDKAKYKYRNLNNVENDNKKDLDENFLRKNSILKESDSYEEQFREKLKLMKNKYHLLHYNILIADHHDPDVVALSYSNLRDESILDDYVEYAHKEILQFMKDDTKILKKYGATVTDIDKNDEIIYVSY